MHTDAPELAPQMPRRIHKGRDHLKIRMTEHKGPLPPALVKYGVRTMHSVHIEFKQWKPHRILNKAYAEHFLLNKSGKVCFNPSGDHKGYIVLNSDPEKIEQGIVKCMKKYTPKVRFTLATAHARA